MAMAGPGTAGGMPRRGLLGSAAAWPAAAGVLDERATVSMNSNPFPGEKIRNRLREAVRKAALAFPRTVVLVLDIDRLKEVNSVYGYAAGDRLLAAVAGRLFARSDPELVARMSGDRFVALLPVATGEVVEKANGLLRRLTRPVPHGDVRLVPQASAGVAVLPDDGEEFDGLLRRAELALDIAKRQGGGRLVRFDPAMEISLVHRKCLESELERAVREDEFELYYQPQFGLADGRVVGVEALLRWPRRPGGPLSPATFVPVAETTGLIRPIGAWVVRRAARTARLWVDRGHPTTVSINVSVAQLRQQDVARIVSRELERYELPAELLEIEVTESLFVDPAQSVIANNIQRLVRLGVRLAIDDFGTGYSSLAYLKRLPAQRIKVDRTFVEGVARDATDEALMGTIIGLGRLFGKRVLAEGVETSEQRAVLEREGCHEAQGFLLARPMPEEECTRFLELAEAAPRVWRASDGNLFRFAQAATSPGA